MVGRLGGEMGVGRWGWEDGGGERVVGGCG